MSLPLLAKQYNPFTTEAKWQQLWEAKGIFQAEAPSQRQTFTVMIPPPNVTGSLHMGHAFEETIIDALVRWKRMMGFNTLWLPGTDHASIAVQTLLEKQLQAEKINKEELGREKFLERAWQWKAESGGTIVKQLRQLGVSVDWSRERFTMDEGLSRAVVEAFVRLYEDGLIYRGEYLVNWCPSSQSAVSDLEVENQEVKGNLWHLRYPVVGTEEYLVVATTRPETMLGDTAVAVHPEDERYKHLIGRSVLLPLVNREIPIIADEYVDRSFGSGCVKITPAHDHNDFEIGKRHHLPMINVLNKDGSINEQGGEFAGQDRFVARKHIVEKLTALGLLEKIEDYVHTVPYSERGKVPIEPFLSAQWFVKITPLAEIALDHFDRLHSPRFIPERWGKVYRDWLVKLKDWCISRQLWWGHQIPAWYIISKTNGVIEKDTPFVVARNGQEAEAKAKALYGEDIQLQQDPDVLDTWFSSGLWCFSTLGWPEATIDFQTFYPTSVLVTGFDIIFFWVARMTMLSGYLTGKMPFHTVYIHGLVRDENNQKMSKSKNNGIDPLVLINKYGTDALRFMLIKEVIGAGQDIRMDYNRKTQESSSVEAARNFANKLWNAARFVLLNLPEAPRVDYDPANLERDDRWILSRYQQTVKQVNQLFNDFLFGEAARALYEFIWGDYCDYYIELVKPRLTGVDGVSKETARSVLVQVLDGILHLLHPFMPHITEEIWHGLWQKGEDEFLALQPYPQPDLGMIDEQIEAEYQLAFDVIRVMRNLRAEAEVKPGQKVKFYLVSEQEREREILKQNQSGIELLAKGENLAILETVPMDLGQTMTGVVETVQVILPLSGVVDLAQVRAKLERSLQKLEPLIASITSRLQNASYLQKAPPEKVEQDRAELAEYQYQVKVLQERLQALQEQK
ncbi:MAG: valine--tRNA ligase [Pseudanabaenaceae cyanobacterium SKYGB_i_bin29]|nr:valine--tRNA ligase [Pseudanabaenaceae cyanobacterium SKYG29]MDW8420987.1 valine--tRNA ligase [Pseudanabaenaceae cyanobacterium SKYGB_i_bin29]